LKTVARELEKYKLDLLGVQEVRWQKGSTEQAKDYTFSYGERNENHQLGRGSFIHKRIITAVSGSQGSSVSIVSDYSLDDCAVEVRTPAEARGLFL
jgi:hypothetical protein